MTNFTRTIATAIALALSALIAADACTSMVVSAKASKNGRPMLWKHRDTDAAGNFITRVNSTAPGQYDYIALFNEGDSLLLDAWTGMNAAGFAIMNTASYNLAPDTARFADQEGRVMALALRVCRTVDDFATLLDTLPRPMGVQANFGVIDGDGRAAYFETNDNGYTVFGVGGPGEPEAMIRTNFSVSGNDSTGMGYVRCDNAHYLLDSLTEARALTPDAFLEGPSKSFYHSLLGGDALATDLRYAVDKDFIPRKITTAAIVIEGFEPGQAQMDMHAILGYPPVGDRHHASFDHIDAELLPTLPGFRAPANEAAKVRAARVFSVPHDSGTRYIDLDYLRTLK